MNTYLLSLLSILLSTQIYAQSLKPSISNGPIPADTASICTIPWYLGSFYTSGKQAGDTAADFTLYSINGDTFNLAATLATGKRVLLVNGSYTCPVFRGKISKIHSVMSTYSASIETVVIYTVEAHPTDTSPYFGYPNPGSQNISAGILYSQPTTYGQRKAIVADLIADNNYNIQAPIYLDDPCQSWWNYYGPAPNNSYLIDTNGMIFSKHGWFDKYPDNIICDIDSMLGIPGSCNPVSNNGTFTYQLLSNDTIWGPEGSTLTIDARMINNSANNCLVFMRRVINDTASGWATSMCADVCYSTTTDTVTILIAAGDTQDFHFYFYTPQFGIDTSRARVTFKNVNNTSNSYTRNFFGITTQSTSVSDLIAIENKLRLYPVPARDQLFINSKIYPTEFIIYDAVGRQIKSTNRSPIDLSELDKGMYLIRIVSEKGEVQTGKFVKD